MILALLLAAAQPPAAPVTPPAPVPETDEGRAALCQATVRRNPEEGLGLANQWLGQGGGLLARQCLGLAYTALERWPMAATVYEQGAQEAVRAGEAGAAADFWVQAGNAWLAAGETRRAISALDTALASPEITPELRGEVHLDRARVLVAEDNLPAARADLDQALTLVPTDPIAWYLSAALARRERNLARARADIGRALGIAASDPDILLLAGTIAGEAGDMAEAERLYRQVVQAAPDSEAGRSAAASLATVREVEVDAPAPAGAQPQPQPDQPG